MFSWLQQDDRSTFGTFPAFIPTSSHNASSSTTLVAPPVPPQINVGNTEVPPTPSPNRFRPTPTRPPPNPSPNLPIPTCPSPTLPVPPTATPAPSTSLPPTPESAPGPSSNNLPRSFLDRVEPAGQVKLFHPCFLYPFVSFFCLFTSTLQADFMFQLCFYHVCFFQSSGNSPLFSSSGPNTAGRRIVTPVRRKMKQGRYNLSVNFFRCVKLTAYALLAIHSR